jgi:hypothetical protein
MRRIPGFLVLSGVIAAIQAVADNWESVKPRILSVWEDLTKALPTWLGGQGDAAAHARLSRDLTETMRTGVESLRGTLSSSANAFEDWFRSTPIGQYFIGRGLLPSAQALALERLGLAPWGGAATPDLANPIGTLRTGQAGNSITTGPINVTVNVTQPTNADPATIGAAAGNAVHSQLRRLLGDSADTVPYGGH